MYNGGTITCQLPTQKKRELPKNTYYMFIFAENVELKILLKLQNVVGAMVIISAQRDENA